MGTIEMTIRSLNESSAASEKTEMAEVDTSLIFKSLKDEFQARGLPVEVDFRQMVNWVKLGDQQTHQIHPYPAKLLPNIANFFVHATSLMPHEKKVLDPFCGSGTVALESSLAGATPYVADANPLALLITKVKTTSYDSVELTDELNRIVSKAKRYRKAPDIAIVNAHHWYHENQKKSLEILLRSVMEVENESLRDFFRVCFSVVARRLSYADQAISVPVKLKTKDRFSELVNKRIQDRINWVETASALEEYRRICVTNIERTALANQTNPTRKRAIVVSDDARNLTNSSLANTECIGSKGVPLIITSPPYGSAQKYIRASSLSLNWLGFVSPTQLTTLEDRSIGREHAPHQRRINLEEISLPKAYDDVLLAIRKTNETRYIITKQYLLEMKRSLQEMAKVTCQGGHVVLVLGNNQVCNQVLRNDQFAIDVMRDAGMNLELSLIDHIKSRGLMTKRNRTASVISRESVLVFSR
ncbi:hypothetical protein [Pseudomonas oryzihabitans]|uniref:hypothetical protein n=1 Tax=Pseudomonas oryzihabitans TaxID=47885 RepID=UPI00214E0DA3|nr:hypothetical protein [Pseudomonas psychrotolerans]UUW70488.1 hypothetical protein NRG74_15460 [Pseudomonas psychrotolerans]